MMTNMIDQTMATPHPPVPVQEVSVNSRHLSAAVVHPQSECLVVQFTQLLSGTHGMPLSYFVLFCNEGLTHNRSCCKSMKENFNQNQYMYCENK